MGGSSSEPRHLLTFRVIGLFVSPMFASTYPLARFWEDAARTYSEAALTR